ncbi:MAG: zinc dependent phospholipase C family protein [Spirochaetes bacterium]|nr:zinc dependent phospholipase C family protein [Spirochaetota bacterium]
MASQFTHLSLGREAALADSATAGIILSPANATLFNLGCQGPDIFYHAQRTKPYGLQYGSLAHKRDYGKLAAALAAYAAAVAKEPVAGREAERIAAYSLGFATHAAVDRATHPFIVWRSGRFDPTKPETRRYRGCHAFYERILDVAYAESTPLGRMSSFDQTFALSLPDDRAPGYLVRALATAFASAYPTRAGFDPLIAKRVANAFADSSYFFRVTDPVVTSMDNDIPDGLGYFDDSKGRRTVAFVYPERLPADMDFANESHAAWSHPCRPDESSTASWFELLDRARDDAVAAMRAVAALIRGVSSPLEAERVVGNGTLNVGNPDGSPAKTVAVQPLPLPEIMERQFRLRVEWASRRE